VILLQILVTGLIIEVDIKGLGDKRLRRRLRSLVSGLAGGIGAPIPMACQDWANIKAAYRFLSNGTVGEAEILAPFPSDAQSGGHHQ
jgi:hypothetical protein